MKDYTKPHEVDDVTLAFPANVIGTYLPNWEDIPERFKQGNAYSNYVQGIFSLGGKFPAFKDDVDSVSAQRHLMAVLGSYQPKHEHKIAGAGYLLSLWVKKEIV